MDRFPPLKVCAAAAILSGCTSDVLDVSYATQAEAVAAGAVQRGWIPAWVPPEARHLREVHSVDTNESALLFTLPVGLNWRPPASCRDADAGELSEPVFSRDWIPELGAGYSYYSCPTPSAVTGSVPMITAVAVQQGGQHVLHWRVFAR